MSKKRKAVWDMYVYNFLIGRKFSCGVKATYRTKLLYNKDFFNEKERTGTTNGFNGK